MTVDLPAPAEPARKASSPRAIANVARSRPSAPLRWTNETRRKSITGGAGDDPAGAGPLEVSASGSVRPRRTCCLRSGTGVDRAGAYRGERSALRTQIGLHRLCIVDPELGAAVGPMTPGGWDALRRDLR